MWRRLALVSPAMGQWRSSVPVDLKLSRTLTGCAVVRNLKICSALPTARSQTDSVSPPPSTDLASSQGQMVHIAIGPRPLQPPPDLKRTNLILQPPPCQWIDGSDTCTHTRKKNEEHLRGLETGAPVSRSWAATKTCSCGKTFLNESWGIFLD